MTLRQERRFPFAFVKNLLEGEVCFSLEASEMKFFTIPLMLLLFMESAENFSMIKMKNSLNWKGIKAR